jgi:hypothetical protein
MKTLYVCMFICMDLTYYYAFVYEILDLISKKVIISMIYGGQVYIYKYIYMIICIFIWRHVCVCIYVCIFICMDLTYYYAFVYEIIDLKSMKVIMSMIYGGQVYIYIYV